MSVNVKAYCINCGKELDAKHKGKCPFCGEKGKHFKVTISETLNIKEKVQVIKTQPIAISTGVGLSTIATAAITRALPPEEKTVWRKTLRYVRNNWVMKKVEIGFPSGVKVTIERKNQS